MHRKIIHSFICFSLLSVSVWAQKETPFMVSDEAIMPWFENMTIEQKIGQLIVAAAYSNRDQNHLKELENWVKKYHLGGLIFFQGNPLSQANMTNQLQKNAKTPLMICMDAEWGLSMRINQTHAFPWAMTLGALRDNEWIYRMSDRIAKQAKRIGVQFNFAPVVDINTNPENPIIGNRSFGEDRMSVYTKSRAYIQAHRNNRVLTSAKHFPGHGDTKADSHKTLPIIPYDMARLDSIELYPFKKLVKDSVTSIMTAHLDLPKFTKQDGLPASVSYKVISDMLKDWMGFKGLVVTDALNMKGIANKYPSGKRALMAFMAGNDLLLMPKDPQQVIEMFKVALKENKISQERLDYSVKKMLKAKYWAGLLEQKNGKKQKPQVKLENLIKDLNTQEDQTINQQIFNEAATVVFNRNNILPLQGKKKYAYLTLGGKKEDGKELWLPMSYYGKVDTITLEKLSLKKLRTIFRQYEAVIIGVFQDTSTPWKSFKISSNDLKWIDQIAKIKPTIVVNFSSPYAIKYLDKSVLNIAAILQMYQNTQEARYAAPRVLFGLLAAKGKLPVSVGKYLKKGMGIYIPANSNVLDIAQKDNAVVQSKGWKKIDSLLEDGLKQSLFPGAQVLVAKDNQVLYHKAVGYYTQKKKQPQTRESIYDLASVTKMVGMTLALMKLEEAKDIDLEEKLREYLPETTHTNKGDISLKDILLHQAGLQPWIPFYKALIGPTGLMKSKFIRTKKSKEFSYRVSKKLYTNKAFQDTIFKRIIESPLLEKKEYKYSDLGFYLLLRIVEKVTGMSLDKYLNKTFFEPMGLQTMGFNPYEKFNTRQIVPTEIDNEFRKDKIQGYVHDPGAALMNGIGGHAGLFSDAEDLTKVLLMLSNGGTYNGTQYLKSSTIQKFNFAYYSDQDNRRGLGLDKQQIFGFDGPSCRCASRESYGHLGFTGVMVWVDPKINLVYVFLSNRTFPEAAANTKFSESYIRANIHRVIYESIENLPPDFDPPYDLN